LETGEFTFRKHCKIAIGIKTIVIVAQLLLRNNSVEKKVLRVRYVRQNTSRKGLPINEG